MDRRHVADRDAFGDADDEPLPASAASRIASAANRGGTKIIEVSRRSRRRRVRPCRRRGSPRRPGRPCPGSRRPRPSSRSRGCGACGTSPRCPVMPWTTRVVRSSTRMLTAAPARSAASSAASSMFAAGTIRGCAASARIRGRPPRSCRPGAPRSGPGVDPLQRPEDPLGDEVAPRDPAEDVHEHDLHGGIREHDLERRRHLVGRRAAADVEEVRRSRARLRDHVERGHHEPGAVADDPDTPSSFTYWRPCSFARASTSSIGN